MTSRRPSPPSLLWAHGFTSLKERAGVKWLMCPFFGVSGPGLGMPGGGPGSRWSALPDVRPGGRFFSRLTLIKALGMVMGAARLE